MKSPLLAHLLGDAVRLTRRGRVADATAAIQAALGAAGLAAPGPAPAGFDAGQHMPRTANPVLDAPAHERAGRYGRPHDAGGQFRSESHATCAGTRHYKVFVPAGHADRRLPLVVMLHGCTQDPDDFATGTRMNLLAQERGAIVVYPRQPPRSNTSKCWNWFRPGDQRRGHGEPAALSALTRHVATAYPVDPDRIYVAGLSAGGAMAAVMLREYPDVYAAAGVHSGLPAGAAHDVPSAFAAMKGDAVAPTGRPGIAPVIVFHGDRDATVHPSNGIRIVGDVIHAGAHAERVGSGSRACTRTVFRTAAGDVCAEHWLVHGAGHAWSGGDPRGSYADADGPDASAEMLRFFLEHPRAAQRR